MDLQYPMTNIEFLFNSTEKHNFGIYNFIIPEHPPLFNVVNWIINVDISGSMIRLCKDGQTKIDQIKHTIKNMLKYFLEVKTEKNISQFITLIAFDHKIKIISKNEELNEEFVQKFNEILIHKFEPTGMTDIGIAIDAASNIIRQAQQQEQAQQQQQAPLIKTIQIFLTDGEITKGETETEKLKSKIMTDDNISNVFIGFGADHSGTLLEDLANTQNGEYYFIESLEKAGMVYGEIIYNSLYEAVRNLKLEIEDGVIYDYKTNKWVKTLNVGSIPYGVTRTWHISTNDKNTWWRYTTEQNQVKIMANYDSISQKGVEYDQPTMNANYPEIDTINKKVEKYKWRQETLELIAETKNYIKLLNINNLMYFAPDSQGYYYEDPDNSGQDCEQESAQQESAQQESAQQDLINKLDKFMLSLKTYIEENNLQEDAFMKNLTDDIYISIHSIHSDKGYLYLSARQHSQGSQRAYNMTNYEELINPNFQDNSNLSSYTQSYETSCASTTSYSSQQTSGLMKTISTQY